MAWLPTVSQPWLWVMAPGARNELTSLVGSPCLEASVLFMLGQARSRNWPPIGFVLFFCFPSCGWLWGVFVEPWLGGSQPGSYRSIYIPSPGPPKKTMRCSLDEPAVNLEGLM